MMNTIVKEIVKAIKLQNSSVHNSIAMNAVHYNLGMLPAIKRAELVLPGVSSKVYLNYFGLSLAESGTGKDLSDSVAKKMTERCLKNYVSELDSLISAAPFREMQPPQFEFSKATPEGLLQTRANIDVLGFGLTNLRISEIQDYLAGGTNLDFFTDIVDSWETGSTAGKSTKASPIPAVHGQPMNIILYGSPGKLLRGSRHGEMLHDKLGSGLGRRSFISYPNVQEVRALSVNRIEKRERTMPIDEIVDVVGKHLLHSYLNSPTKIGVDADAYDMFVDYGYKCEHRALEYDIAEVALRAEMKSRAWKMVRLAGIYAWIIGRKNVSIKDMEDAIEYSEQCGVEADSLLRYKTKPDVLIDVLTYTSASMTRVELMNATGLTRLKEFDEALSLAEELADSRNQVIERTEDKIPRYSLTQLSKIELNKITLSTSKRMGEGWKPLTGEFKDLGSLVSSKTWYSAGTFKDGIRSNDNYEMKQDLMIFDIDEDMTLDTAKAFFSDFKCIIATTKSHQKEKHPGTGDVWDRYRIILIPDSRIELDPETYSKFMLNAMDMMGLPADRQCQDPARFFFGYPDAEVWYSPGERLFPVKACIPSTVKSETVHKRLEKFDTVDGIERYFISSTDKGDRNNKLYRYACVLKDDEKYSDQEIEDMVIALNQKIADPLPERELRMTVLRSIKKKK